MKSIEHLRDYLLANYVDEYGDLDMTYLDFSDFDGDVFISGMKVKGDLYQIGHVVEGDLYQSVHVVEGDLYQSGHEVEGNYTCSNVQVKGNIFVNEPIKLLKEVTAEELAKLGYKLKGEN